MQPDRADLERKSSAVTLSDMEIFVFPEILYALVLANLMSPRIWAWRDDPWFKDIRKLKPYRRILRLKQFIMDHYMFNLDLDTWGLTTKERELARFRGIIDEEALGRSNALFGYEGDKYYFDIDIRRHFGLDKYEGNVIPYWKTETVEAMDAFRFKPGYGNGAGECVSLSTLYAAALYVVCGIPLEQIYLLATPLHSQNFVDVDDGVLTNNRRLVTKAMWFNGTALSAQARRALENEQVTVVSHCTGHLHTMYRDASLDRAAYDRLAGRLREFLKVKFGAEIFGNFLRHARDMQGCFQVRWILHGKPHYIPAERVFAYEHGTSYLLTDPRTRDKLMAEIEQEEFVDDPLPNRVVLNDLEDFVTTNRLDLDRPSDVEMLKSQVMLSCCSREAMIRELIRFCHIHPRLPDADAKDWRPGAKIDLPVDLPREELRARVEALRGVNRTADLAFYAYRDLSKTDPLPFLAAAMQRSPVSKTGAAKLDAATVAALLAEMPADSIYTEPERLAQPDEVWNYGRGDGIEKALTLANILWDRAPSEPAVVEQDGAMARVLHGAGEWLFPTAKKLAPFRWQWPAR